MPLARTSIISFTAVFEFTERCSSTRAATRRLCGGLPVGCVTFVSFGFVSAKAASK
jgi:hypothetical protein